MNLCISSQAKEMRWTICHVYGMNKNLITICMQNIRVFSLSFWLSVNFQKWFQNYFSPLPLNCNITDVL